jgi:hypothetical protein
MALKIYWNYWNHIWNWRTCAFFLLVKQTLMVDLRWHVKGAEINIIGWHDPRLYLAWVYTFFRPFLRSEHYRICIFGGYKTPVVLVVHLIPLFLTLLGLE